MEQFFKEIYSKISKFKFFKIELSTRYSIGFESIFKPFKLFSALKLFELKVLN